MIRVQWDKEKLSSKIGWFASLGSLQVADVLTTAPLRHLEANPLVKNLLYQPYGVYWWWVVKIPPIIILWLVLIYPYNVLGRRLRLLVLSVMTLLYIIVVLNNLENYINNG